MARVYDEQAASLAYSHDAMRPWQRAVKRTADILCSSVGLVLLLPVFIVFAFMLKIQRNGPVFFSQKRIGYKGKPFSIYKFRTLSTVVEDKGPQLIAKGDSVQSTPFEKFLRDHHLDELPQLWNVLIGNMSLVGPRPERKYYIDRIMENSHDYLLIYQMKPGLTSEATIYNGRIYRHHGEDAQATGHGHQISGEQDSSHRPKHHHSNHRMPFPFDGRRDRQTYKNPSAPSLIERVRRCGDNQQRAILRL